MDVLYLHLRLDAPRYADVIADARLKQTTLPGTALGVHRSEDGQEAIIKIVDYDKKKLASRAWRGDVIAAYGPEDIGSLRKIARTRNFRPVVTLSTPAARGK